MGLIPTLLNIYARNKRYSRQKEAFDADAEERKNVQKAQQDALSTLNRQYQPPVIRPLYSPQDIYNSGSPFGGR